MTTKGLTFSPKKQTENTNPDQYRKNQRSQNTTKLADIVDQISFWRHSFNHQRATKPANLGDHGKSQAVLASKTYRQTHISQKFLREHKKEDVRKADAIASGCFSMGFSFTEKILRIPKT
jgi:hypothetical protein